MRDAFGFLPTRAAVPLLAGLLVAVLVLARAFPTLRSPAAPLGIVSLEVAATRERAERILAEWEELGLVDDARRSVRLDFAFIPTYAATLALALSLAGRAARGGGLLDARWAGRVAVGGPVAACAAGALDVAENVGLLRMLERPTPGTAAATAAFAGLKFALLVGGTVAAGGLLAGSALARRR